ncbi:MAG: hypothetical protein MZU84_07325 [Sphingobacterium sp.]|nr:hypothetical protein [Sphingobacterium sp.]
MNIIGHVQGKNCVIIDDMIDTAGSIRSPPPRRFKDAGAKDIYALLHPSALVRYRPTERDHRLADHRTRLHEHRPAVRGEADSRSIVQLSIANLLGQGIDQHHRRPRRLDVVQLNRPKPLHSHETMI